MLLFFYTNVQNFHQKKTPNGDTDDKTKVLQGDTHVSPCSKTGL